MAPNTRAAERRHVTPTQNGNGGKQVPPTDDEQLNGVIADDVIAARLAQLGLTDLSAEDYTKPVTTKQNRSSGRPSILDGNPLVDRLFHGLTAEINRQAELIDGDPDAEVVAQGTMFAGTNAEFSSLRRQIKPAKGDGWAAKQATEAYTIEVKWVKAGNSPNGYSAASEDAHKTVVYIAYVYVYPVEEPPAEGNNAA